MTTTKPQPTPSQAVAPQALDEQAKAMATQTTPLPAYHGVPDAVIALIRQAKTINTASIYLIYAAIVAFLVFGTLKSLAVFHRSETVYTLFHYLPYTLVGLTIPLSCYVAFILLRYRLSQPSMLALCLGVGFGLFLLSSYVAFAAWMGVAFMFRANLTRFFNFVEQP